ncbi:MAG: helix-turn-helix domain-containing protein [Bacteroidetes bacterium]|nr:helix-turn-helix domain-containing protein [Bacteroidota bacterium]
MTQRDVARKSGLTQATISRCENNLTLQLKSNALSRLAQALDTTADYLAGRQDIMNPDDVLRSDSGLREYIELYSALDVDKREQLKGWMRYMVSSGK